MTKSKPLHKKRPAKVPRRLHKAQGAAREVPARKPLHERVPKGATIRRMRVQCGKPTCSAWHGPYWYAAWREGTKTKTAYIGTDERLGEFMRARGSKLGPPEESPRARGRRSAVRGQEYVEQWMNGEED